MRRRRTQKSEKQIAGRQCSPGFINCVKRLCIISKTQNRRDGEQKRKKSFAKKPSERGRRRPDRRKKKINFVHWNLVKINKQCSRLCCYFGYIYQHHRSSCNLLEEKKRKEDLISSSLFTPFLFRLLMALATNYMKTIQLLSGALAE